MLYSPKNKKKQENPKHSFLDQVPMKNYIRFLFKVLSNKTVFSCKMSRMKK